MDGGPNRRAGAPRARSFRRALGATAGLAIALACAACNSAGPAAPALVAASPRGVTVAFESIDGPPESVYGRLVQTLASEAETRQITVVSRNAAAHYRVRIYAATVVYSRRSVIHWVWDVYDANQRRAFRASGEEPVAGAGSATWAAADEQTVRKIARAGMDRLVAFLAAPAREPAPVEAPAVAMGSEP